MIAFGAGNFSLKNPNHTKYLMYGIKEDVLEYAIAPRQEMKGNIYFEISVDLEEFW
ncbi:hypothetical protein [Listeria rocourtiae]|uniref:hypothetical protein n=1 Tax=Listeria rocourtiae TaxID=647910 RepID=UPI003D2F6468